MTEIIAQLDDLITIDIGGVCYMIEKYLCCDLKMLAILYGINGANSNQPCIWCDYNIKGDITDEAGNYIYSSKNINRTLRESMRSIGTKGYKRNSIINIEFRNCVVDTLHLFLRITEKLWKILILWIEQNDATQRNDNLSRRPLMKRFLDFISIECNLYNVYYIKENNNLEESVQFRSFNSNEFETIFTRIFKLTADYNFEDKNGLLRILEPVREIGRPKLRLINHIWLKFYQLYQHSVNRKKFDSSADLTNALKNFFITLKQPRFENCLNLTPYLHTLIHHLPEFIEIHDDINIFNLQGFEKLNQVLRNHYQRSTNKKTKIYLKQLLSIRNRSELIHFKFETSFLNLNNF